MSGYPVAAVATATIFSGLYFADLLYNKKTNWFFVRSLSYAITGSVISGKLFDDWETTSVTMLCVLCLGVLATITYHYFFMISRKGKLGASDSFDYLRFIWEGYPEFGRKLKEAILLEEKYQKELQKSHIKLNKEMKDRLPEFVSKIYFLAQGNSLPAKQYCYVVMDRFVNEFLSKNDARFTLREYDLKSNCMTAIACTDSKFPPAPIPLKKRNMITKSVQDGEPVIYSRNRQWHCKGNGSIEAGRYKNYVSHCLLKSINGIPYLSICLDVKGDSSSRRLEALFDSNILSIIFKAMETKLLSEAQTCASERVAA